MSKFNVGDTVCTPEGDFAKVIISQPDDTGCIVVKQSCNENTIELAYVSYPEDVLDIVKLVTLPDGTKYDVPAPLYDALQNAEDFNECLQEDLGVHKEEDYSHRMTPRRYKAGDAQTYYWSKPENKHE